ncbi:Pam3-gp28 family putative phage holin [Chelatococcus reniformis]|uniref:Uncharacterized protein n=1 Tax=Chelatococcus reniformis TaxID=1494448 RepID=A0A916XPP9_9HYPH|nr:hypothetical protein [Chelatococcus reniformis]GGC90176.1 hypothetical protein GCM10010994_55030 [Chelatococcus reniformis]
MDINSILQGLRYLLLAAGAILVQRGVTDDATVQWAIGGVLAIVPVLWGFWAQRPTAKIAATADLPQVVKPIVTDPATAAKIDKPNVVSGPPGA